MKIELTENCAKWKSHWAKIMLSQYWYILLYTDIYILIMGQVGTSWDELGWVGNQRNYRILTLKKPSRERRRKKEEEYRI